MVEPSLKEVVKAMCKAYPGGREAMAGALGMSVTQFNNNLYEKNGCRFFEVNELEAMEDISNTSLLADYFAQRRGALLVDVPQLEDLDRVDLFTLPSALVGCWLIPRRLNCSRLVPGLNSSRGR